MLLVCYLTALLVFKLYSVNGGMINDCGRVGRMKVQRGNQCTWRKPIPVSFCPSQIPHDPMRNKAWAAVVVSQTTAWPHIRGPRIELRDTF